MMDMPRYIERTEKMRWSCSLYLYRKDGDTDNAVVKAVDTWFADFLKKKQNA